MRRNVNRNVYNAGQI